jgi:hypothetical protein
MYKILTAAEAKVNNVPYHENKPDSWVTLVRVVGEKIDAHAGWFSNPATAQKICDARNTHFADIKKAFKVVKDSDLDENNTVAVDENNPAPVKRGRGRPRKIVSPVDTEAKVCDNSLTGSEEAAEEKTDE